MIDIKLGINDDKPKLYIPQDKYKQIMAYIALAEGEISWLFDVEYDKELEVFRMGDVYLLEQEATAASTDMDEEVVSKFLYEQIKKGVTQMPRGWGHSHAHMSTFFSGTDTHTIGDTLQNETFFVSIVCNKKKEIKGNLKIATPYGLSLSLDDIEVEVEDNEEYPEEWKKEVAEKVKTKSFNAYDWSKDRDESEPEKTTYMFGTKDGSKKFAGKNKKQKIQFLPKDAQKAAKTIRDLQLQYRWNVDLQEWIWLRESNGMIYRDMYQSVTGVDEEVAERMRDLHD